MGVPERRRPFGPRAGVDLDILVAKQVAEYEPSGGGVPAHRGVGDDLRVFPEISGREDGTQTLQPIGTTRRRCRGRPGAGGTPRARGLAARLVPCRRRARTIPPCTRLRCAHQERPCLLGRWQLVPQSGQRGCAGARRPGRKCTSLAARVDCSRGGPRLASGPVSSPAPGYWHAPRASRATHPALATYP